MDKTPPAGRRHSGQTDLALILAPAGTKRVRVIPNGVSPRVGVGLAPNVPGPKAGEGQLVCQVCVWVTRRRSARRSVFGCDLTSGSPITYDQLTDGTMWAQGLFSLPAKITFLAPFGGASWPFVFLGRFFRQKKRNISFVVATPQGVKKESCRLAFHLSYSQNGGDNLQSRRQAQITAHGGDAGPGPKVGLDRMSESEANVLENSR